MPKTVPTKPYDWTYTTTYPGHEDDAPSASRSAPLWRPAETGNSSHTIPYAELSRPDPILFYAEIPLFEDELHDNGSSNLLVKIVSCSGFLQHSHCKRSLLRTASNANLYVHSISLHTPCRQRALSDTRHANLS
jgi:hypothetical protein